MRPNQEGCLLMKAWPPRNRYKWENQTQSTFLKLLTDINLFNEGKLCWCECVSVYVVYRLYSWIPSKLRGHRRDAFPRKSNWKFRPQKTETLMIAWTVMGQWHGFWKSAVQEVLIIPLPLQWPCYEGLTRPSPWSPPSSVICSCLTLIWLC